MALKSITAGRRLEWTGTRDADNTPLLILHTNYTSESEQFSQELQALVDTDRLDGVFGIYYFDEDSFDRLLVPLGNPGTSYDTQRVAMDAEARAAFTEWTFSFTDAFSATAGVRYTEETKGLQATMFNVAPATAPEPPAPTTLCPFAGPRRHRWVACSSPPTASSAEFSSTTGVGQSAVPLQRAPMTYVSWSEGFKSGGFNQRYNAAPPGNAPISFGDETAESWELGFKLDPTGYLRVNVAAFTTEYDDIQMTYRLGVVPLLFNAGVASIDGGEIELAIRADGGPPARCEPRLPGRRFRQHHAAAALWPRDSDGNRDAREPVAVHARVAGAPRGFVQISPAVAWSLTPRVDVSYTDEQFFDAGNSPEIAQDEAVTLLNAALALEAEGRKWRFVLSGNNLTDELYPVAGTSSLTTASGYAEIIYARPRNLTFSITRSF